MTSSARDPHRDDESDILSSPATPSRSIPWLFHPLVDLAAFGGSAIIALGLLGVGGVFGLLHADSPEWTWITTILLIDVAHVYATCFRVYFAPREFQRRRWLYSLVPVVSFLLAWAIYSEGEMLFWRCLAYAAVFHFVRQQYGWVALYRSRAGESSRFGWWIDTLAIYLATVYPLVYWHTHLPRHFRWFQADDFASLPILVERWLLPIYLASMLAYFIRTLWRGLREQLWNPGKDIVVSTTIVCWYVGIVLFNSDYAFTVTNVVIHGVPYMVLVFWFLRKQIRRAGEADYHSSDAEGQVIGRTRFMSATVRFAARSWGSHLLLFLATIWLLAFAEELLWDRAYSLERPWLFGSFQIESRWSHLLVPLLAVPQLTHYILDGFIWRKRPNPEIAEQFGQV